MKHKDWAKGNYGMRREWGEKKREREGERDREKKKSFPIGFTVS